MEVVAEEVEESSEVVQMIQFKSLQVYCNLYLILDNRHLKLSEVLRGICSSLLVF